MMGQGTAGTVHGIVTDEAGKPVPYVSIALNSPAPAGKLIKGGISDVNGRFTLGILPGSYDLVISMMSYRSYRSPVTVGTDTDLGNIKLSDDATHLSEVTVTGRKALIDQRSDRVVMNVGSSVLAAGNTAYNILAMAPSLQVIGGSISMQGKSNVLILLNGKKLPGTTLEDLLSSIPGDQIDRIEIITNPSSKYDADASGGVIEIYTKRTAAMGWNGNVTGNLSKGHRAGGGLNGGINIRAKKIDLSLSGGYTKAGHYETGYDNRLLYRGTEQYGTLDQTKDLQTGNRQTRNFSGSLNFLIDTSQTIGVSVDWINATAAVKGEINTALSADNAVTNSKIGVDNHNKLTFANYNFYYKNVLDRKGSNLLFTANYADYFSSRNQLFNQYNDSGTAITEGINNFTPAYFDIYTGSLDYTKVFSKTTSLDGGIKYGYTKNSSRQESSTIVNNTAENTSDPALSDLGYKEKISAAYLNFNHEFGKFSFQAGLRAEHSQYDVQNGIDSSYFNLFPDVRLDLVTGKNFSSSIGYSKNINRPAYDNLIPYVVLLDNYTSRVGNPFLKPEYAHTFSFYEKFKKYSLRAAYTLTNNTISQMLYYDQSTLRFTRKVDNFRKKHLVSVNLAIPVQVGSWLQSNNSITGFYQNLQYLDPFLNTEMLKRDKTYVNLSSYNSFIISKNLSLEAAASYTSASMEGIYDYGAYSNVNFGIKKDFWSKKAFVKLDVSDLFYDNNRLMTTNMAPLVTRSISRNDTRRVRVTFRYMFGSNGAKNKNVKQQGNSDELGRLGL